MPLVLDDGIGTTVLVDRDDAGDFDSAGFRVAQVGATWDQGDLGGLIVVGNLSV